MPRTEILELHQEFADSKVQTMGKSIDQMVQVPQQDALQGNERERRES